MYKHMSNTIRLEYVNKYFVSNLAEKTPLNNLNKKYKKTKFFKEKNVSFIINKQFLAITCKQRILNKPLKSSYKVYYDCAINSLFEYWEKIVILYKHRENEFKQFYKTNDIQNKFPYYNQFSKQHNFALISDHFQNVRVDANIVERIQDKFYEVTAETLITEILKIMQYNVTEHSENSNYHVTSYSLELAL